MSNGKGLKSCLNTIHGLCEKDIGLSIYFHQFSVFDLTQEGDRGSFLGLNSQKKSVFLDKNATKIQMKSLTVFSFTCDLLEMVRVQHIFATQI